MKKLKVGIIGLGVGWKHAEGFKRIKLCNVTTLCDSSIKKLKAASRSFPGVRTTKIAEAVVSDSEIDIVSIASYDDKHHFQVMSALRNNKHVFVEKPLCQTLPQLKQISRIWKGKSGRIKLMSNLVLRGAPLYKWLKKEIQKGAFGKVYAFDGDYLYGRIEKITKGWRKNINNYSVMEGGGIHLIDLLLWLTGERPRKVFSAGNRISTKNTAFHYKDYVASTFEFDSGLVARITANFGCVHKHQHVLRIFGTKRTFIYDDKGPRLYRTRNASIPAQRISLSGLPSSKAVLIPGFVEAIAKNRKLNAETQRVFDGIALSTFAERALKTGSKENISYV